MAIVLWALAALLVALAVLWAVTRLRQASRKVGSIVDDEVPRLLPLDHPYESWCTCDDCRGRPRTLR